MAILNIRNLPDSVHARLRIRAARAGRSMESEARTIITAACGPVEPTMDAATLQEWVDELYADQPPRGVVNDLIAERRREAARE